MSILFDDPEEGSGYGEKARHLEARMAPWMFLLTILVIPSVLLSFSSDPMWERVGHGLNWLIWGGFVIEALALLSASRLKKSYLKTHTLELAIILFTFPLLLVSTEVSRMLRLLRLLRMLKLPATLRRIFSLNHVAETGFVIVLALLIGTITIGLLEPGLDNPADSLWAAFNLATTGELPDELSRLTYIPAAVLIIVGMIFVSYFTAIIAAWLIHEDQEDERSREQEILLQQQDIMKQQEKILSQQADIINELRGRNEPEA